MKFYKYNRFLDLSWHRVTVPAIKVFEESHYKGLGFYPDKLKAEVKAWGKKQQSNAGVPYRMYSTDKCEFWFKNPKNAFMFKLVWGGE